MGKLQSGLKKLFVPLSVLLGIGIALSWYSFGWVKSQRNYFQKRDFRQLATLSDQIHQKIDNFDPILDNFLSLLHQRESPPPDPAGYLKIICPDLEYQSADDVLEDVRGMPAHDPPSLSIERDEGRY